MKKWVLFLVLLEIFCVSSISAKGKLTKKAHSDDHKKHIADIEEKLEHLLQMEEEIESEIALVEDEEMNLLGEEDDPNEYEVEEDYEDEEEPEEPLIVDDEQKFFEIEEEEEEEEPIMPRAPCNDIFCGAGRECIVNDENEGECICETSCEEEIDPRRKVCSSMNETWISDCELYRQRCFCEDEEPTCANAEYGHMHIDYYGECQELQECEESELDDFPRRMNEWLFNIMRDMASRNILSEHYLELEKEAEIDTNKQWTNAVVWKWCDLDAHPRDRAVSRHELFPIRAPLIALEHCIGTFLDSCDPNDDHYVSLKEWAACTKLSVEDADKLEAMCEDIRDN